MWMLQCPWCPETLWSPCCLWFPRGLRFLTLWKLWPSSDPRARWVPPTDKIRCPVYVQGHRASGSRLDHSPASLWGTYSQHRAQKESQTAAGEACQQMRMSSGGLSGDWSRGLSCYVVEQLEEWHPGQQACLPDGKRQVWGGAVPLRATMFPGLKAELYYLWSGSCRHLTWIILLRLWGTKKSLSTIYYEKWSHLANPAKLRLGEFE